ncbi:MAG: hypothetical protein IPJ80_01735 [Saprospiraceae bacterium]|nr:hypothetical protein [Saprospiraceae bacterium]MBK7912203.1 hypothetical protein [Saprospiraceae bacterium]
MKNNINNNISLPDAQRMIEDYKYLHGTDSDFLASEYYNLEFLKSIINHPRCKGIRVFNAIKTEGEKKQNRLIVVGVDEHEKIIVPKNNNIAGVSAAGLGLSLGFVETVVGVAEHGRPCPPDCLKAEKIF